MRGKRRGRMNWWGSTKENLMGKLFVGILIGILATLAGWVVIFIYKEVTPPLFDKIHVVQNEETDKVIVRGGFRTPRVSIAPDGKMSCVIRRNDDGDLDLEVCLTPDVTIEPADLSRNTKLSWDGTVIPDEAGQRWEHVGGVSHHTKYREKYGDTIALAQMYWIGRIRTDGKNIFFEEVYQDEVRSKWKKIAVTASSKK